MNSMTIKGEGKDLGGNMDQEIGEATGDRALQVNGIVDQLTGSAKQLAGAAQDALADPAPVLAKAKGFAQARPFAAAALAGVIGLALLNTLRGR